MINRIKELIDKLNYHTKLYDEGNPILTDEQWDELYFELVGLENLTGIYLDNSPTQKITYNIVNDLKKVRHDHPMLSLQKTQSIDEVNDFIGDKPYIIMLKIDGLTCSLGYENGRLVSAETRGDGEIGEDVLHNANVIKNIPKKIPYKGKLTVDGEIICKSNMFKKYYADEYKNPRNFASGSIRLLDSRECDERCLSFIAWDAVNFYTDEIFTLSERLAFLQELGFEITDFDTISKFNEDTIESFKKGANHQDIPIDGLVIKYNDCKYYDSLGKTDHHFRGGMAFKFYDETYETHLKNIEWTMGRTGVLTPVAIFGPVEIDGCQVERASLHNVSVMKELLGGLPFVGQKVHVFKAHQIIPQIKSAEVAPADGVRYLHIPKSCPVCGSPTTLETLIDSTNLVCVNLECEGKLINKLDHFCGKKGLDIRGLSLATLNKLINWGWVKNYEDIFNLVSYRSEWINKPGFGSSSVCNILNAIEESKECELNKFIAALGIPLIGSRASKDLANEFGSWTNFINAIETNFKFYVLPNFGGEMHNSIISFDYSEAKILAEKYLIVCDKTIGEPETASELKDKTVVITGKLNAFKNRDALKEKIESLGGKVSGSISGKTNYLINNDVNSTSSKNAAAKKLNIPIISEEDFCKMFGI